MANIHEIEHGIGKSVKENLPGVAALLVGSLVIFGSGIDQTHSASYMKSVQTGQIIRELAEKYHIYQRCSTTLSSGGSDTSCVNDIVGGLHTEAEKKVVLANYQEEVRTRAAEIPVDSTAHNRSLIDALGVFLGGTVGSIGIAEIIRRKRERNGRR